MPAWTLIGDTLISMCNDDIVFMARATRLNQALQVSLGYKGVRLSTAQSRLPGKGPVDQH
jgi:hypothetical protein